MKKKIGIVALFAIVLAVGTVFYIIKDRDGYNDAVQINWGIELPKGNEHTVSIDSGASVFGDGERFNVLEYSEEPLFSDEFVFSETLPNATQARQYLEELGLGGEYVNGFWNTNNFFYIKDSNENNELWMSFDKETNTVYLLESFI